ncbi:hypothetical protein IE4771_PB00292 (plasmid) [Rhizobium etli bv. mimosae str. IE4771]|uniref:Uncharacterized protein n=1 Tax=Rhizobium etli bv. mimosae str. IE4771 TaxID=1432050 RepID=A0A060ID93_RHIET|nr:hypothetical protein [Rhizobium sp. IE4771]AIC30020.1 hypothetical protein IE4771_PB00292 [Rhizobium sp. IE4771]
MKHAVSRISLSAIFLSGCQATPLPQDWSNANTVDIVKKIQCEARDAVAAYAISYLTNTKHPLATQALGRDFEKHPEKLANLQLKELDDVSAAYVHQYKQSFLYYDFQFDMSNLSSAGLGLDLLNPFSNGQRIFGGSISAERTNQNVRSFRRGDTIDDLFALYVDETDPAPIKRYVDHCTGLKTGNGMYPITGKIGLEEFITTFAALDNDLGLKPKDKVDDFVQVVTFTTTLKAGATPKLVLSNFISNDISLTDGNLDFKGSRVDKHQVTLSIATNRLKESAQERAGRSLDKFQQQNSRSVFGVTGPSSADLIR